jgi:hypothetical protein
MDATLRSGELPRAPTPIDRKEDHVKVSEALIAWNPGTDQVRVGPLIQEGQADWTDHPVSYACTGGAAYGHVRLLEGPDALRHVMSEFLNLVVHNRVDPQAAHRAFMEIDEYREVESYMHENMNRVFGEG